MVSGSGRVAMPSAPQRPSAITPRATAATSPIRPCSAAGRARPAPEVGTIRLDAVRPDRQDTLPLRSVELLVEAVVHDRSPRQSAPSGAPERLVRLGLGLQARQADVAQQVIVERPQLLAAARPLLPQPPRVEAVAQPKHRSVVEAVLCAMQARTSVPVSRPPSPASRRAWRSRPVDQSVSCFELPAYTGPFRGPTRCLL